LFSHRRPGSDARSPALPGYGIEQAAGDFAAHDLRVTYTPSQGTPARVQFQHHSA
jgi:hypothetical protein